MLIAALAALVLAQDPPAPAPVPPTPPAEAAQDPAVAALLAEAPTEEQVEAAGEGLEPLIEQMQAEAEAVRADAALSGPDKEARIQAIIAARQGQLTAFTELLARFVMAEALREGAALVEAQAAADQVSAAVSAGLLAALTGAHEERGEDDAPAAGPA
jgi:hypothetical protein